MGIRKLLPYGVKDYYPDEVKKLKEILSAVEGELNLWGYEEVKLPHLEFAELFETALGGRIKDGFPVWDCEEGRLLMLRYDFTPQILRFVLHRRDRSYPLRIYYKGETFKGGGELWEELQVGFELVGTESAEADAEILAIVKTVLEKLKLEDFVIAVGHRRAWDYLSSAFGVENLRKKLYSEGLKPYLKTYPLGEFPEGLPVEVHSDVERLKNLLETYGLLDERVGFLPSLEPRRDYYDGLFFEVVVEGKTVAGGGRYGKLFEGFGERIPATGGAFKISELFGIAKLPKKPKEGYYIIDTTEDKRLGWKLAKLLREHGKPAERDIVSRSIEESVEIARLKGYEKIVIVGNAKVEGAITLPPDFADQTETILKVMGLNGEEKN